MILFYIWFLMIFRNSFSKSLSEINLFFYVIMLLIWYVNYFLKLILLLAIWWYFIFVVIKFFSDYFRIFLNFFKLILNNINFNYMDIIFGYIWYDLYCSFERVRLVFDWRCWCDEFVCVFFFYFFKKRYKK